MNSRAMQNARSGFSLLEMLVGMTLLAVVLAIAVPFFTMQSGAVTKGAGRMDAQQNARFAVNEIDRELRMAGAGVVDAQPMLIMAQANAITFNANLTAHDSSDKGAVYFDPDQTAQAVAALTKTNQVYLPLSAARYPDTSYAQGSGASATPSLAETISFWASPDSTTTRTDDYILFRRVNDLAQEVVIRGVIIPTGSTLFQYYKSDSLGQPVMIPVASLPIRHTAPIHGSTADTAKSALTDSITLVRLSVSGLYRDPKAGDVIRTVQTGVAIENAGLLRHATCGESPILGVVALTAVATGGASPKVVLTWTRAADESAGEKDVERYVVYRRRLTDLLFGEPIAGQSAGFVTYQFTDTQVISGDKWVYGVAAQDCTPANSPIGITGTVTVP